MSRIDLLQNVSFFAGLSERELNSLAKCLARRTFARGVIIFHKGSPGRTLYIIESGKVRIFVLSESGREMSVNIYGPGDVFGELALLDGLPRSAGAIVVQKATVLTLHRDDLLWHLGECPRVARSIIEVLTARLRYTTAYAESLAFLDVYGRVADRLLELADRYGIERGEAVEIGLQLTQAELASWVAATREHVNKVLGAFRDQGLIRIEGQTITLLEQQRLKRRVLD
ncbi:MAG: Crp/Fnr family transcriptional regulator [Anaerolineae bacterium]|jgi:CRP/FNR family transcriptional regulator/CRP/FNR family cyclic AMP-dependent transcriptional regulator